VLADTKMAVSDVAGAVPKTGYKTAAVNFAPSWTGTGCRTRSNWTGAGCAGGVSLDSGCVRGRERLRVPTRVCSPSCGTFHDRADGVVAL
jgi:hypothetical protein